MNLWTTAGLAATIVAGAAWNIEIPSGTDIPVTIDESIAVTADNVGDTFQGHVTRDVVVRGKVVIPEGTPADVKLTTDNTHRDQATLRLTSLRVNGKEQSVSASSAKADADETGLDTKEKTAAGAVAGAVVGAVTGAGVLEGAVVGAGGGLAWGLLDKQGSQIKEDSRVRFSLEDDLDVK